MEENVKNSWGKPVFRVILHKCSKYHEDWSNNKFSFQFNLVCPLYLKLLKNTLGRYNCIRFGMIRGYAVPHFTNHLTRALILSYIGIKSFSVMPRFTARVFTKNIEGLDSNEDESTVLYLTQYGKMDSFIKSC